MATRRFCLMFLKLIYTCIADLNLGLHVIQKQNRCNNFCQSYDPFSICCSNCHRFPQAYNGKMFLTSIICYFFCQIFMILADIKTIIKSIKSSQWSGLIHHVRVACLTLTRIEAGKVFCLLVAR